MQVTDIIKETQAEIVTGNSLSNQVHIERAFSADKKTGLGIPLLKQHAEATGGKISIRSVENEGTKVCARLGYHHIDPQPLGDISSTIVGLIRSNPDTNRIYIHTINKKEFKLDTGEIKKELNGLEIANASVIQFIKEMIDENLKVLSDGV